MTEKAAYDAIHARWDEIDFHYFGIPWATIIDGARAKSSKVGDILSALQKLCLNVPKSERRVTVAQHIHALRFVELFKAAGITDLFWSHAVVGQTVVDGIAIHPFPLFPAQAPDFDDKVSSKPKDYLANFIGAYNPSIYLTDVRTKIFEDAGSSDDVLIVKRDRWHFDRSVYDEQIAGQKPEEAQLSREAQMTDEYLNAIRQSWFTLCPTGSGPNSIRVFESLHLGSIPIILTQSLRLPGPRQLWENAALIEEDSEDGYRRAVEQARQMSEAMRQQKLAAARDLLEFVSPTAYYRLIRSQLGDRRQTTNA